MQKYKLTYDWQDIAEVEIDESEKTSALMKEMILFWSGGEDRLEDNCGDVTKTWLKQLGRFILERGKEPNNDEGWAKLDGTYGIKLTRVNSWDVDEDNIEIESLF